MSFRSGWFMTWACATGTSMVDAYTDQCISFQSNMASCGCSALRMVEMEMAAAKNGLLTMILGSMPGAALEDDA